MAEHLRAIPGWVFWPLLAASLVWSVYQFRDWFRREDAKVARWQAEADTLRRAK